MALAGMCRFRASGGGLEVELMEMKSLARSVVYLREGGELVLFVPSGQYGFWLRRLDGGGRLDIDVMTPAARVKFLAAKVAHLLRRGPLYAGGALLGFLRRRGKLTAAQAGTAQASWPQSLPARHAETPVALTRDYAVSIIIPTKVHADLLRSCVASLDLLRGVTTELIVVDNGATSAPMLQLLDELRARRDTRVLRLDIPFNFSRLCNAGARLARHECLLFLNDDIEATDGEWLLHMLGFAVRPDVGVTGARLLYPSGLLQHAGIASNLVPGPGHPFRLAPREVWSSEPLLAQAGEVDAVTGACLLIGAGLFHQLGGFNEDDFAISLNDVDLCLRVRERGLKVIYAPQATLIHKESQSRRPDDHPAELARRQAELAAYFRRHPRAARSSGYYPVRFRRDGDGAVAI
jgi:GT2 family glycosyltransferase